MGVSANGLWKLRARLGYGLARWLVRFPALVRQPRLWAWMEGQYARMAKLGDVRAQSFYGHVLLFRGQGLAARNEGRRLLQLAAEAGDGKAAYQVGLLCLQETPQQAADAGMAAHWWCLAAAAGHPLAAHKLAALYRDGGPGLAADAVAARQMEQRAAELGL
ncbi:sel1 repeat family protein [Pseudomonas sp. N040]|uniref:sel1 repeat family protein n=1 Tax=Pseudomonas sp. N040 TaxID=2785325 RepID=UPI0018A2A120|nr:sel1 repeat family protein [Pseudomonas sp. N040]MBF7729786.1 sel1 repeat family protein [Pseudomonas sp. N040]MBW7013428.1 sel1 repeat family protein [Pseudomonas sp. N040]